MPPSYFAFIVCGGGAGTDLLASLGALVSTGRGRWAETATAKIKVDKNMPINFIP
jgi:hypothetical protein